MLWLSVRLNLPEVAIEDAEDGLYVMFFSNPRPGSTIIRVENHQYLIPGLQHSVIAPGKKVFGPIPEFTPPTEPASETRDPAQVAFEGSMDDEDPDDVMVNRNGIAPPD